jgi:hypothetical protein
MELSLMSNGVQEWWSNGILQQWEKNSRRYSGNLNNPTIPTKGGFLPIAAAEPMTVSLNYQKLGRSPRFEFSPSLQYSNTPVVCHRVEVKPA